MLGHLEYACKLWNENTAHRIVHAAAGLHFAQRHVSSSFALHAVATASKKLADELGYLPHPCL